jgi:NADH-quinone oxidoreductase subunit F
MDLRVGEASASEAERRAVDALLGEPRSRWDGGSREVVEEGQFALAGREARDRRHMLLPALHAVQSEIGWISPGALNYVCTRLMVPPAEAYGVASFYAMFSTKPAPPVVVHVCDDIACKTRGADALCDDLSARMGPEGVETADGSAAWHRSPCLGMCEKAPAVLLQRAGQDDWAFGRADADVVGQAIARGEFRRHIAVIEGDPADRDKVPQARGERDPSLKLLRRVNLVDPDSLDDYRANGGYAALRRAVQLGPDGVIREVMDSKLLGRGGAAFPTGRKWDAVARTPARPHYVVCNADESEPGTFKDRVLMENDPYALVEALTIAGYATGSEKGFIYVRGEYPLAFRRLENAIERARARGFLGGDVMGEGFAFDIEMRKGAGAYICGEETALFNSIEGKRGEPRNKPPFPVTHGLFGKPTDINNVETLVNVLDIVADGGPAYAAIGTEESTGTKLFCLSGCVQTPGVYEVEFGVTLRELIGLAGGVPDGRELKAVLLGGAAGSFVTPDQLDVPLTFEGTRAIGASLGSGVIMLFDDTVDMAGILLRIARFFRDESCGQCVPCRVGTVRQEELLHRLVSGTRERSAADGMALLEEIEVVMKDASICGLGQTAASAVRSGLGRLDVIGGDG